jgi:predicted RNA methylase
MRSDKALRNAFRRLQLPTSDDPRAIVATVAPAIPTDIRTAWDDLEGDDDARVAFAFQHPTVAHLLTTGITLPTFREELEWILTRFDQGLPAGPVIDVGSGSGVTAAVIALASKRPVTACEPAPGAAQAIAHVAEIVGVEVRAVEEPVSMLSDELFGDAGVAVVQSVLSYIGFGSGDAPAKQPSCSALVTALSTVGDALVIEHTMNARGSTETWTSFMMQMTHSGMYPVWETACFATGYNVFTPDVPAHERPLYARPKLCLRFCPSGDADGARSQLDELLAAHPPGAGLDV